MAEIAAHAPELVGDAARRAARAEAERGRREPLDLPAAEARYSEITGERLHV